ATMLKKGYGFAAFFRMLAAMLSLINRGWAGILMSKFLPDVPAIYDLAVDYNGQQQLYYLIDKVQAKKKVSFFHNDYNKWPYYYSADKKYYPNTDRIYSVSPGCVDSLRNVFPEVAHKVELFENISSLSVILSLVDEKIPEDTTLPLLLTVGHLC